MCESAAAIPVESEDTPVTKLSSSTGKKLSATQSNVRTIAKEATGLENAVVGLGVMAEL